MSIRNPIAIACSPEGMAVVLCDDGTVWSRTATPLPGNMGFGKKWRQVGSAVPGTKGADTEDAGEALED